MRYTNRCLPLPLPLPSKMRPRHLAFGTSQDSQRHSTFRDCLETRLQDRDCIPGSDITQAWSHCSAMALFILHSVRFTPVLCDCLLRF